MARTKIRPLGQREVVCNLMDDLGPDTVLLVEDHALSFKAGEERSSRVARGMAWGKERTYTYTVCEAVSAAPTSKMTFRGNVPK